MGSQVRTCMAKAISGDTQVCIMECHLLPTGHTYYLTSKWMGITITTRSRTIWMSVWWASVQIQLVSSVKAVCPSHLTTWANSRCNRLSQVSTSSSQHLWSMVEIRHRQVCTVVPTRAITLCLQVWVFSNSSWQQIRTVDSSNYRMTLIDTGAEQVVLQMAQVWQEASHGSQIRCQCMTTGKETTFSTLSSSTTGWSELKWKHRLTSQQGRDKSRDGTASGSP